MTTGISRRQFLRAGALGASVLGFGTFKEVLAQSGPIRIAAILPLSGPAAIVGTNARIGSDLTAEAINKAGGVFGRPIELVYLDDKSRPNDAIAAAREAASANLHLWGGGLQSVNVLALLPVLASSKSVLVTGGASANPLTHESFSPNLFPGIESDYQRARGMARIAVEKFPNVLKWGGVVTETTGYIDTYKMFAKYLAEYHAAKGRKVTFAEPIIVKFNTADFRVQASELTGSGIEGLFSLVVGGDGITFWKQARTFNLGRELKAVIDQTIDISVAKVLRKDMPANIWSLVSWYHGLYRDNPLVRDFYEAYVAKTNDRLPSGFVQYGNTFVAGLAAGLRAAK
ncbi:MAG TPA: ABC transporter substrate-binding protein, partial [Candidatus Polarisedimenticolia bacterium]|nr:ABC transporter substrate-binding protein [Candidatus Polarisedimenticolia bacterium]